MPIIERKSSGLMTSPQGGLPFDPYTSFVHYFGGCISGAAGVLAGHPLDTVKVRLQTQHPNHRQYTGTFNCFMTIVRREGFKGLYKGMSSPLASLSAINAIVFGVHGHVTRTQGDPNSIWSHFLAGAAAGCAQSAIAAPSELLKLKLQIQYDTAHTVYRSPFHAMRSLIHTNGLGTLSRGYLATLLRDAPAFGIYFASYEWLARHFSHNGKMESLTWWQLLSAGGLAGMLSWLFNYPTDVIKTRFQADLSYKSYRHVIRELYAENGYRAFFAGLGSTLLRAFPSNAATFFTVEWTYRILLDLELLHVGAAPHHVQNQHFVLMNDFWDKNSFLLPEAGSTSIDPMIHGCRFL